MTSDRSDASFFLDTGVRERAVISGGVDFAATLKFTRMSTFGRIEGKTSGITLIWYTRSIFNTGNYRLHDHVFKRHAYTPIDPTDPFFATAD